MPNMYQSPAAVMTATGPAVTDPRALQEHFEARPRRSRPPAGADGAAGLLRGHFRGAGQVWGAGGAFPGLPPNAASPPCQNLNVCDNLADHLVGNVYVKFREEESARAAALALAGRYYSGRPILVEFSPVTDFRESTCRQYEENTCNRGGYCNFMHLRPISRDLRKRLFGRYRAPSPPRDRRDDRDRRDERGRREEPRRDEREHRRSRSREDRDRERRREEREREERVSARGMSDEARRAMVASWNAGKGEEGVKEEAPQ